MFRQRSSPATGLPRISSNSKIREVLKMKIALGVILGDIAENYNFEVEV